MYHRSFILFLLLSVACQAPRDAEQKDRLGLSLPLTGSLAYLGKNIQAGIDMYLADHPELREQIEIYTEDTATSEPAKGVAGARKLLEVHKIQTMIIASSQVLEASKDLIERKKVVTFGIVGTDALKGFRYGLKHWVSADAEAGSLVERMVDLDVRSLAVVTSESPAFLMREAALKNCLTKELSAATVSFDHVSALDEIPTTATKLAQAKPDAVVLLLLPGPVGQMAKALRNVGYKGQFLATISAIDAGEIAASAGALVGTEYVDVDVPTSFGDRYQREYGQAMSVGVANGYDIMAILHQARVKLGSWRDAESLNEAVRVKNFKGVMGEYSFVSDGNNTFDFSTVIKTVR